MKRVKLNFYCVQPISIKSDALKRLFLSKTKIDKIEKIAVDEGSKPEWLRRFNNLSRVYASFFVLDPDPVDVSILSDQLKDQFLVNGKLSLSPHLITSQVCAYLVYDYRLMYFNLIYELGFQFALDDLTNYLKFNPDAVLKMDLYNTVRNLLVKESDAGVPATWVTETQRSAREKISWIFNTAYHCDCDCESVCILNNTGNITNVVTQEGLSEECYRDLASRFVSLNNAAERLSNYSEPLFLSNDQIYHFNGRFHTILLRDAVDRYRYIPIQFHIQFMWFYLNGINEIMEKLNNEIIGDDTLKNLESQNRFIDTLIHKVEILSLHNANFKTAIEIDNERVYRQIGPKWNVEQLLRTSNRYIAFFKDYLQRIYTRKTSRTEHKQNVILAFISILQLIALISVWNDYIALLNEENLDKANELLFLFSRYEYLRYFNIFSPVLIALIIIGLFLFFRRK